MRAHLLILCTLLACGSDEAQTTTRLMGPEWENCLPSGKITTNRGGGGTLCVRQSAATLSDPTQLITRSGALVVAPFADNGVARSTDVGVTFGGPLNQPPALSGRWVHPWLWRDPDSNRVFFNVFNLNSGSCGDGTGSHLWFSDDDGANWTAVAGGVGCNSWDWGKLITGPARTSASKAALAQNAYPNLVYFCAGGDALIVGPRRFCFRSNDGGKTFTRTASNPIDTGLAEQGYPNAGVIAPDGTFYIAHQSPTGLQLAKSEDEGDSWTHLSVPNAHLSSFLSLNYLSSNVAADRDGNLYVAWVDDADLRPYLATSKDRGATWSAPITIARAEVHAAACLNLSVESPGHVAFAYFGSARAEAPPNSGYSISDQRPYDAYLAVSRDVFAESPTFWTAQVNDPAVPALTGFQFNVSEYLGPPAFAADGSVFAGFLSGGAGVIAHLAI